MEDPPKKALEAPIVHMEIPDFSIPVDSELKSKSLKIWMLDTPHMRAFNITWLAFFLTFLATFGPASLITVIRQNLSLTKTELGSSGVAAVMGAIGGRIGMGTFTDIFGPRMATVGILCLTAPAVFCISLVTNFTGFWLIRCLIGISLSMFVVCQYWVGSMFNVRIVGTANAISAGWGNMGGGVCHFVLPALYEGFKGSYPPFQAWRWSFFIPGALYIATAALAFVFGDDSASGQFRDLKHEGRIPSSKSNTWLILKVALLNYRMWILTLTYGYSFGVELTVDNIIVSYFFDHFGLTLTVAGAFGAMFGFMNLFSRASGGLLSDIAGHYYGMRGRLWTLWILQTIGGVTCLILAYVAESLGGTLAVMIVFSIFIQQACGATFGVVPFISRRSYGVVSGFVGAGGNAGAGLTQGVFFGGQYDFSTPEGLKWMGVLIIIVTATVPFIHFPMWGSMFLSGSSDVSEEDYYIQEWTAEEVSEGLHLTAMRFADESKSQRGSLAFRRAQADAKAAELPDAKA